MKHVYITGRGIISPAGFSLRENWDHLLAGKSPLAYEGHLPVGVLPASFQSPIDELLKEKNLKHHDRAVLLGVIAARAAVYESGDDAENWAVIMGSSRGVTLSLEEAAHQFAAGKVPRPMTSPTTTMGAFSASVASALGARNLSISVSSACSTSLQATGLGYLLVKTGQASGAVVGGAEACVTPFTLAMLESAKVYSKASGDYPCRPFHPERSGLVLGEGAACLVLESEPRSVPFARITGYGAATESASLTGISMEGEALQQAIRQALEQAGLNPSDISFLVAHGAGTQKGDAAEQAAFGAVFGKKVPPLVAHKWLTGHMLGAASSYSIALATQHLILGKLSRHPYFDANLPMGREHDLEQADHALVVALGFGGSAGAIALSSV